MKTLALVVVLLLAACGNPSTANTSNASVQESYVILHILDNGHRLIAGRYTSLPQCSTAKGDLRLNATPKNSAIWQPKRLVCVTEEFWQQSLRPSPTR